VIVLLMLMLMLMLILTECVRVVDGYT